LVGEMRKSAAPFSRTLSGINHSVAGELQSRKYR